LGEASLEVSDASPLLTGIVTRVFGFLNSSFPVEYIFKVP
jgi:hypothetical protein